MNTEKKSVEVKARMAPSLKKDAERYLGNYQITASQAINFFYRAVVEAKGLPFDLRPNAKTLAAMDEHDRAALKTYSSYEDMMKDIDSEEEGDA